MFFFGHASNEFDLSDFQMLYSEKLHCLKLSVQFSAKILQTEEQLF